MSFALLPTPIIVFQLLALLLSTAIEAWIFSRKLYLSRKVCVRYAITINLASTAYIWFLGLIIQAILPLKYKVYLISYVFFSNFYDIQQSWAITGLFVLGLSIVFWIVCFVEFKGIDLLEAFLYPRTSDEDTKQELLKRLYNALITNDMERLSTIFIANAFSNSTILLILLISLVQQYD